MTLEQRRVFIALAECQHVTCAAEALEKALAKFGRPEIFNADRGSQLTSAAFHIPAATKKDPAVRGMIGKKRAVRIPIKESLYMVPLRGSTSMASSVCAMSPVSSNRVRNHF
jgi:hypothetical protein